VLVYQAAQPQGCKSGLSTLNPSAIAAARSGIIGSNEERYGQSILL
jgi:hypothetical protein